jgi:aminopeptidase YwaD
VTFSTRPWYGVPHGCYTFSVIRTSIAALVLAALAGTSQAPGAQAPAPYRAALHLSGKIGTRPAAGRGEARAQRYVASQFQAAGLAVAVDKFRVPGKGISRNVVGELETPASCLQIVMGHVDSGPDGPGANDNASGVGVLVALAAKLKSLDPPCDVWLASTGAEERGYTHAANHLGAAALVGRVKQLGRASDLRFAYDNDEVGRLGRFWLRSPVAAPRVGVEGAILAAARRAAVTVRWVRDEGTGNSDEREFNLAGLGSAVLEGWHAREPCRELPCDRPGRVQKRSLIRALRIAENVVEGT